MNFYIHDIAYFFCSFAIYEHVTSVKYGIFNFWNVNVNCWVRGGGACQSHFIRLSRKHHHWFSSLTSLEHRWETMKIHPPQLIWSVFSHTLPKMCVFLQPFLPGMFIVYRRRICAAAGESETNTERRSGHFGGMRCCFSARVMLSVSGQAPGLDVTLKEVLWDSAGGRNLKNPPTAKIPHLHSCANRQRLLSWTAPKQSENGIGSL